MKFNIQTVSGKRFSVDLPAVLQASALRTQVASTTGIPSDKLKIIHRGTTVVASDARVPLSEGETILAVVTRAPVAGVPLDNEVSPDDHEVLKLTLPATAARWQRRLLSTLRHEWHLPETLIIILFALPFRTWLAIIAWVVCAPLAHRLSVGPLYILGTLIVVIFLNLGTRQAGEASAYSIFNNFQELPGQLNAHRLDDQMRRGQM